MTQRSTDMCYRRRYHTACIKQGCFYICLFVFLTQIKFQTDLPLGSAADLFGKYFSNPVQVPKKKKSLVTVL